MICMLQTVFSTITERISPTMYGNIAANIFQSHHVKLISLLCDLSVSSSWDLPCPLSNSIPLACRVCAFVSFWKKQAAEAIPSFKLWFTVMTLFYFKFVHILSMLSSWQLAPMSPIKKTERMPKMIFWHFFPSFQSNSKNINQSMPILFCFINKLNFYIAISTLWRSIINLGEVGANKCK